MFTTLITTGTVDPFANFSQLLTGDLKASEKVIIAAAAGGLGQICVQWAKNYDCHVIAICSSEEGATYLMQFHNDVSIMKVVVEML
ncbi:prostaglandin reductase-3-like [Tachypleus tridentatus]|uniref:prostaglandin reductase-3-like n=1 Tax=Tachypleus tridentatus TaxID=6853 RepID=UPI003FD29195